MTTGMLFDTRLIMMPTLLTFLRLTPLLSTTASFTHAYMERITNTAFLSAPPTSSAMSHSILDGYTPSAPPVNTQDVASAKEKVIPVWFVNFFCTGVLSVVGLNSVTLISAAANLWLYPVGLARYRRFYITGFVAGLAHYAFVPLVSPSVQRLFELCVKQEKGEKNMGQGKSAVDCVTQWVGVHKIRMSTVDLVAWASFAFGVVGVLTP